MQVKDAAKPQGLFRDAQRPTARFLKGKLASEILGVSGSCLRNWANTGRLRCVRSPGGIRLYDVDSVRGERRQRKDRRDAADPADKLVTNDRIDAVYCRVSSSKQRADLARQAAHLVELCGKDDPKVFQDVGSGLNFKRRGLRALLERCLEGDVRSIAVAHRDRLCRFGYELLEWLVVDRCGVELVVLETDRPEQATPESELTKDLLAILHVFSSRVCGLRRYDRRGTGRGQGEERRRASEAGEATGGA